MCDESGQALLDALLVPDVRKDLLEHRNLRAFGAGIASPACAISVSRPVVLSVTVLPPVFGPVMTMMKYSSSR